MTQDDNQLHMLAGFVGDAPQIDYFDDIPDAALQAEPATLERLTILAANSKDLEREITDATVALAELQSKHDKIMKDQIPGIMAELGLAEFKMTDGSVISVKEDVKCGITEEHKPAAWLWLEENDFDGIIKTKVGVEFGKGEMESAEKAIEALQAAGFAASMDRAVHPSTLKSFVKEQLEAGTNLPLATFGVWPFKMAKIKAPAVKKARK